MSDYPKTRQQTECPLCHLDKDVGLIACWPCFRSSGLKYGEPHAERAVLEFEAAICAEVR